MCIVRGQWSGLTTCRQEGVYSTVEYISDPACNGSVNFSMFTREMDAHNEYHFIMNREFDYNYSSIMFPNIIWVRKENWEIALKTAAVLPVVIMGVLGNAVLLNIIVRNKQLHTPTNFLIANMATADMATVLICSWMLLCVDFFQNYVLGEFGCKTAGFFECFLLLTGVLNLITITYDRLTAIVLPMDTRLTVRVSNYIMAITWVVGIALGVPLLFFRSYQERQWKNFFESYCAEDPSVYTYWYFVITLIVWLPLAVMTVCYITIFIKLKRYEQKILRREHPLCVSHKTRVARMMFGIVIVFILCRVPFTVLVFKRSQLLKTANKDTVDRTFLILWFASKYLMLANAAINPLIYGMTNKNFKRAFSTSSMSRWLFGTTSNNNNNNTAAAASPQPPRHRTQESAPCPQSRLCPDKGESKHWFTAPKHHHKTKTVSPDFCYM